MLLLTGRQVARGRFLKSDSSCDQYMPCTKPLIHIKHICSPDWFPAFPAVQASWSIIPVNGDCAFAEHEIRMHVMSKTNFFTVRSPLPSRVRAGRHGSMPPNSVRVSATNEAQMRETGHPAPYGGGGRRRLGGNHGPPIMTPPTKTQTLMRTTFSCEIAPVYAAHANTATARTKKAPTKKSSCLKINWTTTKNARADKKASSITPPCPVTHYPCWEQCAKALIVIIGAQSGPRIGIQEGPPLSTL